MRDNWISAVDDTRIITAFIKHPEINSKHRGIIHITAHSAFVRADNHQVVTVQPDIRDAAQKRLENLVGR